MSYIVPDGSSPARRPRPRRWVWAGAATVAVLALVAVAFAIGRSSQRPESDPTSALPSALPAASAVTWSVVGTQPVPVSADHGPRERSGGLASGFTHDEVGAVMATMNISARIIGGAGPLIFETTIRQQCVGDLTAMLKAVQQDSASTPPAALIPEEVLYRITRGDPTSDVVVVSIAASTPQSRSLGGYAEFSRTLQWTDGDWKVQVPPGGTRIVTDIDGYTSLGKPHA